MVRSSTAQPAAGAARSGHRRAPIDMEHLARQALGDPGLQGEVLRLFDGIVNVYLGRLQKSTTVADLLIHLHTLRGASAGVGARAIEALAQSAEHELRQGHPASPERLSDLRFAVEDCSQFIAAYLASEAA